MIALDVLHKNVVHLFFYNSIQPKNEVEVYGQPTPDTKPNPCFPNAFLTMKANESADCAAPCAHSGPTGLFFFLSLR